MKKTLFAFLSFCTLLLTACSPNAEARLQAEQAQMELIRVKAALEEAQAELKAGQPDQGMLAHIVYFKLKSDLSEQDKAAFIAEVKKLNQIEVVRDLQIGSFEDLGDARALSDYDMAMQMTFVSKADYEQYQQHPIHLALKENTGKYMGGPPATYDFLTK